MTKNSPAKHKRTQYTTEFKEQAIRLWQTGDYGSQAELARFLKMRNSRPLSKWIEQEKETRGGSPGLIVLKKLELAGIEAHLETAITTAQDTLMQLEEKDRAHYSMQLIDRLTELRKNIVILPGDFDDGTGIISQDDAMKIIALIPEEGRGAFIEALKEAKKL